LMVVIGAALGLPAVFAASKVIGSLLFGLSAADPAALSLATLLVFVVAGVAGFLPARRASLTDPTVALRNE
jgi:putative ABC transport system permease protein